MKCQKFILFILFISFNICAQDFCSELTQDECVSAPDCELNYDAAGQFEECVESENDGPPECILDCPGLSDIGPDGNPNELCDWIKAKGNITQKEMLSTFNCGIGMVLALKEADVTDAIKLLDSLDIDSKVIGKVEPKKKEEEPIEIKVN